MNIKCLYDVEQVCYNMKQERVAVLVTDGTFTPGSGDMHNVILSSTYVLCEQGAAHLPLWMRAP